MAESTIETSKRFPAPPVEVAVMGATGNVGSEVVDALAAAGHPVRALSRKPPESAGAGVRSFAVDLNDGPSLREALAGVDGAFMMAGYDDEGIVAELRRAGAARVALLSSNSVERNGPANAVAAYHLASERALEASGLAWTFIRPNTLMSNALRWAEAVRAGEPVVAPFAGVPIALNDPRDVAAAAAAALTTGDLDGRALHLSGPEALLPAEQVAVLADVLGREIGFRAQPDDEARAEMEGQMPKAYVDAFFEFFVDGTADETTVRPTVEETIGSPPRSFRQWAEAHRDAFL